MSNAPDSNDPKVVVVLEDEKFPHMRVHLATVDRDNKEKAHILAPTEEEAAEGRSRLEGCLSHWKITPGLLIIKPQLAIAVTVRNHSQTTWALPFNSIRKNCFMVPALTGLDDFDVFCAWNQPYMSFNDDVISAPYSFTLYFGTEGVAHARDVQRMLSQVSNPAESDSFESTIFRSCFDPNAPEFIERLRATLLERRDDPA